VLTTTSTACHTIDNFLVNFQKTRVMLLGFTKWFQNDLIYTFRSVPWNDAMECMGSLSAKCLLQLPLTQKRRLCRNFTFAAEYDRQEQASPNIFARVPHELLHNNPRAYVRPTFYQINKFSGIFFHYCQNGFAGRIWPAGRCLETPDQEEDRVGFSYATLK